MYICKGGRHHKLITASFIFCHVSVIYAFCSIIIYCLVFVFCWQIRHYDMYVPMALCHLCVYIRSTIYVLHMPMPMKWKITWTSYKETLITFDEDKQNTRQVELVIVLFSGDPCSMNLMTMSIFFLLLDRIE